MFNDDVSAIPTTGCNVLNTNDTISNYSPDNYTRKTYIYRGGKWYLHRTESQTYGWAEFVPFFYGMAFVLFVCTILFVRWSVRGVLGRF